MKQRAAIARGLLSDPEIVFLDEPTTAVDPVGAYEIRRMVRDRIVQDGGRTVILTTNVMEEAEIICDRLALLNRGRIEMMGTVDSLRERFQPDERYTLTVSGIAESALGMLRCIPDVHDLTAQPGEDGKLEVALSARRGSEAVPEVIRRLVDASASVWSCTRNELSLEEMFRIAFGRTATPEPPAHNDQQPVAGSVA
jgi:ABC-2 type transport system ATP-binding protein